MTALRPIVLIRVTVTADSEAAPPYENSGARARRPGAPNGKRPYERFGMWLAAVIGDIAYFVCGKEILKVTFGHGYIETHGVAYDTYPIDGIRLSDEKE